MTVSTRALSMCSCCVGLPIWMTVSTVVCWLTDLDDGVHRGIVHGNRAICRRFFTGDRVICQRLSTRKLSMHEHTCVFTLCLAHRSGWRCPLGHCPQGTKSYAGACARGQCLCTCRLSDLNDGVHQGIVHGRRSHMPELVHKKIIHARTHLCVCAVSAHRVGWRVHRSNVHEDEVLIDNGCRSLSMRTMSMKTMSMYKHTLSTQRCRRLYCPCGQCPSGHRQPARRTDTARTNTQIAMDEGCGGHVYVDKYVIQRKLFIP